MNITPELPPLIGESPAFMQVMEHVSLAAPQDRPVLVIGERGTGKELIGMRLHFLSKRWQGPYVQLNCAALPENLLESELFGHEAGAFTGATRQRMGRFELADSGTLFLDEIGNASPPVQEKILRVVEYGTFERVGGNETIQVDVRVVGATNIDLPAAADRGEFRHDLLDRLSFDVLTIPPLRFRRPDVPLLTHHFGRAMAQEMDWIGYPGFSSDALDALIAHNWPGNVRELRNTVERAVYLHADENRPVEVVSFDPFESPYRPREPIIGSTLPEAEMTPAPPSPPETSVPDAAIPIDLRETVDGFERGLLVQALTANRHHQKATATHLGLTYSQLRNRLKKFGLLDA